MTEKAIEINLSALKKNWAVLSLILIFLLSFYVRTYTFHYNYLLNVDSYFEYRYMNFIVKYGEIPDKDYYMVVPEGLPTQGNRVDIPYQWLGAYMYFITRVVFPGMELWQFLIYLPALIASLMVIPAYYIGKCIYDKKAGVLLAFFMVFNQNIFMRSIGGDPDTDAIVMLLPLITMALFLLAFKSLEKENKPFNKKAIVLSMLSGAFLAVFAYTWVGYWYMLYLIAGFVFLKIVVDMITSFGKARKRETLKSNIPLIANFALFLLVFFAITLPVYSFDPFSFIGATHLKAETGKYPNVFVSVQEMMTGGDYKETIQRAGTTFFFLTFVMCLPYLLITYLKSRKHLDTALLILIWSCGALFAAVFAVRFGILLAIPISLGSAIVLAKIWRMALGEDKEIFE